jgi:hypothetical protein
MSAIHMSLPEGPKSDPSWLAHTQTPQTPNDTHIRVHIVRDDQSRDGRVGEVDAIVLQ